MNIRTDLAFESRSFYMEAAQEDSIEGVEYQEDEKENLKIKRVKVLTSQASELLKKAPGNYITLELEHMEYISNIEDTAKLLSEQMRPIIPVTKEDSVLVVGLGNRAITADALGPQVLNHLVVSRHLKQQMPEFAQPLNCVSAIAPGVLGITGIETGEVIGGICDRMKPTCIVAIDALAAGSLSRIASTIQIADTGIVPGSGVANHRNALTKETLGIPVIAIGVPTVVTIGAILHESMQAVSNQDACSPEMQKDVIQYLEKHQQMVVTPKSIDQIIQKISKLIAASLNMVLHPLLSFAELESFV